MLAITLTIILLCGIRKSHKSKENWYHENMYTIFFAALAAAVLDISMYIKFIELLFRL